MEAGVYDTVNERERNYGGKQGRGEKGRDRRRKRGRNQKICQNVKVSSYAWAYHCGTVDAGICIDERKGGGILQG